MALSLHPLSLNNKPTILRPHGFLADPNTCGICMRLSYVTTINIFMEINAMQVTTSGLCVDDGGQRGKVSSVGPFDRLNGSYLPFECRLARFSGRSSSLSDR